MHFCNLPSSSKKALCLSKIALNTRNPHIDKELLLLLLLSKIAGGAATTAATTWLSPGTGTLINEVVQLLRLQEVDPRDVLLLAPHVQTKQQL